MSTGVRAGAGVVAARVYRVVLRGLSVAVPDPVDVSVPEGMCNGGAEEAAEEDRVQYLEDVNQGWPGR